MTRTSTLELTRRDKQQVRTRPRTPAPDQVAAALQISASDRTIAIPLGLARQLVMRKCGVGRQVAWTALLVADGETVDLDPTTGSVSVRVA